MRDRTTYFYFCLCPIIYIRCLCLYVNVLVKLIQSDRLVDARLWSSGAECVMWLVKIRDDTQYISVYTQRRLRWGRQTESKTSSNESEYADLINGDRGRLNRLINVAPHVDWWFAEKYGWVEGSTRALTPKSIYPPSINVDGSYWSPYPRQAQACAPALLWFVAKN